MSKKTIDKPKVFISYAWGTEEYQSKVLSFASQLLSDGIDVVLDKWDLSEGNDTYAFMEKCVMDESITNVLMLLDPTYSKKADQHEGGVGTETQVISAHVYQDVNQDKFIPIVFERDKDGNVCKPAYLQGRLHFDLSDTEEYDDTYIRLVKKLYGEETYKKPELGSKPTWVSQSIEISVKKKNSFEVLKSNIPIKAKANKFRNFISQIFDEIEQQINDTPLVSPSNEDVLSFYEKLYKYRDEYLELISYAAHVEKAEKIIASKLEDINKVIVESKNIISDAGKVFIHELFLYTVAGYLRDEDYEALGYLLGRAYYNPCAYRSERNQMDGYNIFYAGNKGILSDAMKARDNKNYLSGAAEYWIKNVATDFCTKEQFVLADVLCFNYSIFGKGYLDSWPWFPLLYVYDNEYNSALSAIAKRMISKEYMEDVLVLFGYKSIDEFKLKFHEIVEEKKQGVYKEYRYSQSFDSPAMLDHFITEEKIATIR